MCVFKPYQSTCMSVTPNSWDATLVALKDPAWLPRSSEDVPPVTLKHFQSAMDVESSEVLEWPNPWQGKSYPKWI